MRASPPFWRVGGASAGYALTTQNRTFWWAGQAARGNL
jgi:hypothetical protein